MSEKIHVTGGHRLEGEISVSGSKNSALICMAAACLCDDESPITITNVPDISDVSVMMDILSALGKKITRERDIITMSGGISDYNVPLAQSSFIRASVYCVGMLLGVMGKAVSGMPGGDKIGARPIDIHLQAFEKMGASCSVRNGRIYAEAPNGLRGTEIYLRFPSVGATCNAILAAVRADGKTVIENAAKEPEIVDVCNFLMKMNVSVFGAGTDRIVITGNRRHLHGGFEHEIISDRIEAGVFAIASAITGGDVWIKNSVIRHNRPLISTLTEADVICRETNDGFRVTGRGKLNPLNITMMPFPGPPTDLQPLFTVMATQAPGESLIVDNVFPDRFQYIYELVRMGADIEHFGNSIRVKGKSNLIGMPIEGTDIRAVTALVCGGLIADGETIVEGVKHLERGYVQLDEKLRALGADIQII